MKVTTMRAILILLLFALLFTCGKDYLDVKPQGSLDENTLANAEGVMAALISAYSLLDKNPGYFFAPGESGSNWSLGSVSADDAYKGSEPFDFPEISLVELFLWLSDNPVFNGNFIADYEGVTRANAVMDLLKKVDDLSEADRRSFEGEALFLRVYFHFDAYKIWKNIPYYTEEDTDFRKANDENVLPLLIEDLLIAVDKLPEDQNAIGRVTRGAAQALLGKVYLFDQQYSKAQEMFGKVVDSDKYALQDCFHELFSVDGENGSEMILAFQASVNDGAPLGANSNPDFLNYPFNDGPVGCCGFFQPTQNLVNAFKVDADGLPLLDDFNEKDLDDGDFVDPRLDWTVGRDDVPYLNWGLHRPSWIRARDYAGPYSPKKNVYYKDAGQSAIGGGWAPQLRSSLNVQLIRYADVLLMLAECEVELDNFERARDLVNQVRRRAANCAQGPGESTANIAVAPNDSSITWAKYKIGTYDTPWTDADFARQAVRFERRLELAMEGHRFFDLRRWGIAKAVMNEYLRTESLKRDYLKASPGYADRHDLYPLPLQQIELSKINGVPRLKQNPGY